MKAKSVTLVLKGANQALFRELEQNSVLHDLGAKIVGIKLAKKKTKKNA